MCLVVALLTAAAVSRNALWFEDDSLRKDTVRKSPRKARPHNNLGVLYARAGRINEALAEFEAALRSDPDYLDALVNIGIHHERPGRFEGALASYMRAIELAPGFAKAHYNLGVFYYRTGSKDSAIASFKRALELEPGTEKRGKRSAGSCSILE